MLTLVLMLSTAPLPKTAHPNGLDAHQERAVRDAVYNNDVASGTYKKDGLPFRAMVLPKPLESLYGTHPQGVLAVLLSIAEGGRPWDSVAAVSYAFELMEGPGSGVVCVEIFDPKTYDAVDQVWGRTPRKHWLIKLRKKIDTSRPLAENP